MSVRWRVFGLSTAFIALFVLAGCTVSTHDENGKNGKEAKDVDIRTPFGSLRVRKGPIDPKETGLAAYPGAQQETSTNDDDNSSANVNISSSLFGMKLSVLKYQTDDSPEKVLSFYRKQMSHYGKVIDCTGGFNMSFHRHDKDSEVTCDDQGDGSHSYKQELKVGTKNNQRIVAVKPSGKGTEFVMLYVRAHDDKDTM
ncbi:MAG TPA: hypothetical protein VFP59_11980 [Candidatus Angelobacter sp.]|nr:hypothetical protein [Candidatus Angelobacter sp.]